MTTSVATLGDIARMNGLEQLRLVQNGKFSVPTIGDARLHPCGATAPPG